MRHFQVLALTVLTVIAVELGLIVIKLPTPTAQAQQNMAPIPGELTAEHQTLKKQLDALTAKLMAKVDALSSEMKRYDTSGIAHQVILVKDMLRKHMGCQYPQCYQ